MKYVQCTQGGYSRIEFFVVCLFLLSLPGWLLAQTHQVVVSNQYETTFIQTFPETFLKHTTDGSFNGAESVYAADLDGDGDVDVLGAAEQADDITWWENTDGYATNWIEHVLDGSFDGAVSVCASDVDGDGDMDVLGAAANADDITWWENVGGGASNWTKHIVSGDFNEARSVCAADVDGDGDLDVLGAASSADDIIWWENTDGNGTNWIEHSVDGAFDGAYSVYAADVDGDGDLDVLGAAQYADEIAWWENNGGAGISWRKHVVDSDFDSARSVFSADIDGDGDMDILGAAAFANDIVWWENADGSGGNWVVHIVDGSFGGAFSVYAEDVDGDGDLDVLGAAANSDEIVWWENITGNGTNWAKYTLDKPFNSARSVYAADMNGDGNIDILGAAWQDDYIAWWENGSEQVASFSSPCWTNTLDASTNLVALLTNNLAWGNSFTQLTCSGWIRTGSDPDSGLGSNTSYFSLTNDALITFNWTTQYWLNITAEDHGAVDMGDGWHNSGSNITLAATADVSYQFTGWSGDVPPSQTNENPLTLTMTGTRNVIANFSLPYEMVVSNQYATTFVRTFPGTFSKHTVEGNFSESTFVRAADVDGDGDLDVLGAAEKMGIGEIAWWENTTGSGTNWSKRLVDGNFSGACSVYAADLDGDGDADMLGAAWDADDITWWENVDGGGDSWNTHILDGSFNGARSVCAADVDGDGDMDVLGAASSADDITWWENIDGSATNWNKHTVDGNFDGATCVYAEDVDGDGDIDILGAAQTADDITWWENTDGHGTLWSKHTVNGSFDVAASVYAKDVDGDGDVDVLGAARYGDKITWWENKNGIGTSWSEHTVDAAFNSAKSVYAADVDGDGDVDVLGAASIDDDITWWENLNGRGTSWGEHTLNGGFDGANSIYAADVDGDGDLDVLGSAGNLRDIAWWENESEHISTFHAPCQTNGMGAWANLYVKLTNDVFRPNDFTQYVCDGWVRTGCEPNSGGGINTDRFSMTNDAVITFNWVTHYWMEVSAVNGSVDVADGWHDAGSNVTIIATPDVPYQFAGWSGNVVSSQTNDNPLTLSMTGSYDLTAHFKRPRYKVVVQNQHKLTRIRAFPETFTKHAADEAFGLARSVYAVDIDGDGDMDILGAAEQDDDVSWWENSDGSGTNWSEYLVAGSFDGASSVYSADVDGDGDMDVLGAAEFANDITWWENIDGAGTNWNEHTVDGDFGWAHSVYAEDVDGDGDMDVLGAAFGADSITWWENADSNGTAWVEHTVDGAFDGAESVYAVDMDDDGDMDVLGAAYYADDITWWENLGGSGTTWSEHVVDGDFDGAKAVRAADVDGDGDFDVIGVAWDVGEVTWWENTAGDGASWSEHLISAGLIQPWFVCAADMDNDGDVDILSADSDPDVDDPVIWWENTDGDGSAWAAHTVDGTFNGASSVDAADMDNDGDFDVLGSSYVGNEIACWENSLGLASIFYASSWTNMLDASTNLFAFLTNSYVSGNNFTQFVYTGWVRTGSDPDSGPGLNTGSFSLTNDAVITFNWDTNYWMENLTAGSGSTDPESGWQRADSNVQVHATASNGWLFMGWSGDASGDFSQESVIVPMVRPVSVTATFSNDADDDGLLNANETALGTDPRKKDSDGDGSDDPDELIAGTSPTNSLSVLAVELTPGGTANELSFFGVSGRYYKIEYTDDLGGTWTPLGTVSPGSDAVIQKLDFDAGPKRFYRVRVSDNPADL